MPNKKIGIYINHQGSKVYGHKTIVRYLDSWVRSSLIKKDGVVLHLYADTDLNCEKFQCPAFRELYDDVVRGVIDTIVLPSSRGLKRIEVQPVSPKPLQHYWQKIIILVRELKNKYR